MAKDLRDKPLATMGRIPLTGTLKFVVNPLQPWHENIKKRQVKAPKIYFADTGMLHALLQLTTLKDLNMHPKVDTSWEGFIIRQIIEHIGVTANECFFWATHGGAELDLMLVRGRKRWGFEVKLTSSPGITASMRNAMDDLKLQRLFVVHAGKDSFDLIKNIRGHRGNESSRRTKTLVMLVGLLKLVSSLGSEAFLVDVPEPSAKTTHETKGHRDQ